MLFLSLFAILFFASLLIQRTFLGWSLTSWRYGLLGFTLSAVGAEIALALAVFGQDFTIKYAYDYSLKNVSFPISLGLLWAGQPGANWIFLLTMSLVTTIIFFAVPLKRTPSLEERVFFSYYLLGFFALVLLTSSPFDCLLPFAPTEGRELNPLLQHYALSFHPFLLLTSTAMFFGLVVLDLFPFERKAQQKFSLGLKYFNLGLLSLAITAGSFWAYHVLGWGGWWFWDPIETISFVHWIGALILLHQHGQQKKTPSMLLWTVIALDLWIVRSDQLVSVHSFVAQGSQIFWILYALGCALIAIAQGVLSEKWHHYQGLIALFLFAFLGLFSPFLASFLGTKIQMSPAYYEQVLSMIVVFFLLLRSALPYKKILSLIWIFLFFIEASLLSLLIFLGLVILGVIYYHDSYKDKHFFHTLVLIAVFLCFAQKNFSFQKEIELGELKNSIPSFEKISEPYSEKHQGHIVTHRNLFFSDGSHIRLEEIFYPEHGEQLNPIIYKHCWNGSDYGFSWNADLERIQIFYRPLMGQIWLCALILAMRFLIGGAHLFNSYRKEYLHVEKNTLSLEPPALLGHFDLSS